MNNKLSYEIQKIIKQAEKEMLGLNHPYVGSEHLLLSLLSLNSIDNITSKYELTYDNFKNELIRIVGSSSKKSKVILYTPLLRNIIAEFLEQEAKNEFKLLELVLTSEEGIALRILDTMNIDIDGLCDELKYNKNSSLKEIGLNLNEKAKDKLIGREEEIKLIEEIILRKNKNNPILIGDAGVGKSAIVYELARRIKAGEVPHYLKNYIIISVDMASILSNTKYRGEFETKLNNIIEEVKSKKNIILFIDEIHTIVKSGGSEGSIDAANILKPYLATNEIKLIGATTINEYEKFVSKDKALERRFQKVYIAEPNIDETINILNGVIPQYEEYYNVKISKKDIIKIVMLTDKYIHNNHNPDKSLEVLDSVLSKIVIENKNENILNEYLINNDYKNAYELKKKILKNNLTIKEKDIKEVIEKIGNVKILDKTVYNNLKKYLLKYTYNYSVSNLINALNKDGVKSILFKGNEKLGKSYTAKLIADYLNYNLITINGNEYSSPMSLTRLIGSTSGYVGYDDSSLFDQIKYKPYSLLLIKDIDLVTGSVFDLIRNIIDNGYITNNKGEVINFTSCIIIMTSSNNKTSVGYQSKTQGEIIDDVIEFHPLNKKDLKRIIDDYHLTVDINKFNEQITFKELSKLLPDSIDKYSKTML